MTTEELKNHLERIIKKYIEDENVSLNLIAKMSTKNVKGILAEVDMHKKKVYENQDIEIIKDIYYYFC